VSTTKRVDFSIDQFCLFQNAVRIRGWAFCKAHQIRDLHLKVKNLSPIELCSYGLPSQDVAAAGYGAGARSVRFDEIVNINAPSEDIANAELVVAFADGDVSVVGGLGNPAPGGTHAVFGRFLHDIGQKPNGRLLEIGSRARSGITRRDLIPSGWNYTGLDIMAGPNVDIVGDAHELSRIFQKETFDAVMALAVLEHLIMPWKFATELNKVMNLGGVGIFLTHQTWPMHDEPWDFFRFSRHGFTGILNKFTGFRIIEAKMGEPCFIVAEKLHPITNFSEVPSGFLSSVVLFEKIGETSLSWPVGVSDLTDTMYPTGEIQALRPAGR
jgi:hypothetical protein